MIAGGAAAAPVASVKTSAASPMIDFICRPVSIEDVTHEKGLQRVESLSWLSTDKLTLGLIRQPRRGWAAATAITAS